MNVDSNEAIVTPTPAPPKKKRNVVVILILLMLICGFLILAVFLRPQNSVERQTTAPLPDTLIATVADEKVYLRDVSDVAREQYTEGAINKEALAISLEIFIERKLLDSEAKTYNITITDQEVQNALANAPSQLTFIKRYELLKEKLIPHLLQSRTAYTVGFWIAPENYQGVTLTPQLESLVTQQRKDALPALTEVEQQMKEGKEPLTIAKEIIEKYPSLERIMGVNGYLLYRLDEEDEPLLKKPYLYTNPENDTENAILLTTLFRLKPGQIGLARDETGNAGGFVVRVVDETGGPYKNYNAWLNAQREKLVTIHQSL